MKADLMKRVCLQALAMRETTRRLSCPGRTSSSHSRLSVGLGSNPCCPTAPAHAGCVGIGICQALGMKAGSWLGSFSAPLPLSGGQGPTRSCQGHPILQPGS